MNIEHDKTVHISQVINKLSFKIESGTLSIKEIYPVKHFGLIKFLESKYIPLKIARRYLKELYIYNKKSKKHFYSLGFKNDEDGYMAQNEVFNGCIGNKAITVIRGSDYPSKGIHIFNEAMDFLSIVSDEKDGRLKDDSIVLNSISCLKEPKAYIQNYGYRATYSWLDNNKTGANVQKDLVEFLQTERNLTHFPLNYLYAPHENVTAWRIARLKATG